MCSRETQRVLVVAIAAAVLIIFVHPVTIGLPAPLPSKVRFTVQLPSWTVLSLARPMVELITEGSHIEGIFQIRLPASERVTALNKLRC